MFVFFEFMNVDGDFVGIDMDLFCVIVKDQGFEVEICQFGFDVVVQVLQLNQVDVVMVGMLIIDVCQQIFDFSDLYFMSGVQLGVLEFSDIEFLDDFDGKIVVVKMGMQGQIFVEENVDEYGFCVMFYQDMIDMVDVVKVGQVVGYFEDFLVFVYGIQQGLGFWFVGEFVFGGEYGFVVNKGENVEFLEMFNVGFVDLQDFGEYDEIVDMYFVLGDDVQEVQFIDIIFVVVIYWFVFMQGLWFIIFVMIVVVIVVFIFGVIFGFGCIFKIVLFCWIVIVYVYVFCGMLILIQVFFVFFVILQLIFDFKFDLFVVGVIILLLNIGVYMMEIICGGIQVVDFGQVEVLCLLGLSYWKIMQKVVFLQVFCIMVLLFVNQGIIIFKDILLISVIGFVEFIFVLCQIIVLMYLLVQVLMVVVIIYFVVIMLLMLFVNCLERMFNV